jgi:hypothetical protein
VSDVDEIRQQMAQIRHDMHYDVSNVVSEVEEVMDWRSVLRNHPYIAMGVALAIGYFVVPRRRRRIEEAVEGVRPLLEAAATTREYVPVQVEKPPKSLGRRAAGWALGLLWPLVGQTVQAYAAMWLENQLKQHLNLNLQPPRPEDGPPPAGKSGDSYGGDPVYRMPKRG